MISFLLDAIARRTNPLGDRSIAYLLRRCGVVDPTPEQIAATRALAARLC